MEIWLKIVLTSWSDKINPMKSREKMSLMFYTNCIHFLWHYNKSQETQRLKTTKTGYLPVSRSKVWQGPHQPEIRAVAYSHLGCCMGESTSFLKFWKIFNWNVFKKVARMEANLTTHHMKNIRSNSNWSAQRRPLFKALKSWTQVIVNYIGTSRPKLKMVKIKAKWKSHG